MVAKAPLTRWMLALTVATLLALAGPTPPSAAAEGDGALTILDGKAGCLSAPSWRAKPGCTRIRGLRKPDDVAVSPDGRNVYATSPLDNTIAVFRRDARTGTLRQLRGPGGCLNPNGRYRCSRARGIRGAARIEVSTDGRSVYALGIEGIAVFRRDGDTGELEQLRKEAGCVGARLPGPRRERCAPGRAMARPSDLALSPNGRFLYVASSWDVESATAQGGIAVFRRDPITGRLRQHSGARGCVTARGAQHCRRARSMPRLGATRLVLDRRGHNVYASTASGTFTGIMVFDRLRGGGLRQPQGQAGCVSPAGAGGCTPARALDAPHALATSPVGGDNLYVSSSVFLPSGTRHGSIVNLLRDRASGALVQPLGALGCVWWNGGPGCAATHSEMHAAGEIVVSPDGRNAYAPLISELGNAGMIVFGRNRATGELFQLPGRSGCVAYAVTPECADSGGLAATAVALSPDGGNAYVTSGSGSPDGMGLPPYYALVVYGRAR
jgi:DNA-binding beta-propeller fold protein YncE